MTFTMKIGSTLSSTKRHIGWVGSEGVGLALCGVRVAWGSELTAMIEKGQGIEDVPSTYCKSCVKILPRAWPGRA